MATKFHIPAWKDTSLARQRLLDQLTTGLEEGRKLTLVSAPAGYGKTTLASSWISSLEAGLRCSWLSVDESDNDPARFLNYFLTAFFTLDDTLREDLEHLVHLPQPPAVSGLLDDLINALAQLGTPGMIVLDDYHVISNPEIHDALEYFIQHQPPRIHLVFLTREDPPLPLARLRARRQMTEIRAHELRFTAAEARQFFDEAAVKDLDDSCIEELEARTEGWAVGLQLAALALHRHPDPTAFIGTFHGSHRFILDYLAEEVIQKLESNVREFLFSTSILDRFNADLCCALTGREDSAEVIAFLEQANLFIVPLDGERIWYRYHHLFADYLRSQLDTAAQTGAYLRAAAWYESEGLLEQAVSCALASGDAGAAADYLGRALTRDVTWSSGNMSLLSAWLDALPSGTLEGRPKLCLDASRILYLMGRFDQAEARISQAEEILAGMPDLSEKQGLAAAARVYRGSIAAVRGQSQSALELISGALDQLPSGDHLVRGRAYFSLGLADELSGLLEQAVSNYMQSSEEAEAAGVLFLAVHARSAAAQVQIRQGRLFLADQACQKAILLAAGQQIPPLGLAHVIRGGIALERNVPDRAEEYLDKGMSLARRGGLMDDVILGLSVLARLYTLQRREEEASTAIQEAVSIVERFQIPRLSALLAAYRARLQLRFGHLKAALQWAEEVLTQNPAASHEYEALTLVRVLLAASQLEPVLPVLELLLEKSNSSGHVQAVLEVQLLLSLYYQAAGDLKSAQRWLTESIRLGAAGGYARIYLDEGQPLMELLPAVRSAAPEFVDSLMRILAEETGKTISLLDQLIEPLSDQELRVLELIAAGRSNKEIGEELFISVGTAKWHVHNVFQKLGVSSRPQAIVRAQELGL